MPFNVGDHVMHSSHGSGQITAIEEKPVSGGNPRLYYAVVINKSTVWVPVDSGGDSNLRLLVSNSALTHYRELLKSRPTPLLADPRQRYLTLTRRLQQGSFEVQCEVIRDLTAHSWPKPLGQMDSAALRKVQDTVSQEWATAAGIPLWEATREITALLQEGRRAYST
jgi:RNA polymerase-interacting CarD/CdnL/TRCF family regulator